MLRLSRLVCNMVPLTGGAAAHHLLSWPNIFLQIHTGVVIYTTDLPPLPLVFFEYVSFEYQAAPPIATTEPRKLVEEIGFLKITIDSTIVKICFTLPATVTVNALVFFVVSKLEIFRANAMKPETNKTK